MTGETKGDVIRKDTDVQTPGPARREKDVVTAGSEDSFPASDPPSYGGAIAGSPPSHLPASQPPTSQPPAKRGGAGKDKARSG